MGDNELGMFLRSRRAAISPAEVGLPAGPRRRISGLRRAEVAMLAGVSVEYLTRLEQGRDRHPSAQVLTALGEALRLTPSQRVHVYRLSKASGSGFSCLGDAVPGRDVRATVRALLTRLEPTPAMLLNRLNEIVGRTVGFERLAGPIGLLDGPVPNFARYVFTDRRARTAYPDWEHVADEQVAMLKHGPFRADRHVAGLADELTLAAGEAFSRRAGTVPGLPRSNGILRWRHPEVGELRLAYEMLDLAAEDDQRLVVYLPADPATAAALDRLDGLRRPHGLRAVPG
ncbi:helix-turn-helix domain-containing protein [Plantactinospora sp. WMMB782]|uniref:helix-turn-helix domain-containing protein n=1 Tax=Plantactinospora sp. WMMB782 TaxID=3404121 RepID=UPI003B92F537